MSEAERDEVVADLADLAVYQALLESRGVRGIVVDCADCGRAMPGEPLICKAHARRPAASGPFRKIGWYLNVDQEMRRLMFTLAHAHGTLLRFNAISRSPAPSPLRRG